MGPATSTVRWWCRMAARICAVPAPRICCNGPTRSGTSNALAGRKHEPHLSADSQIALLHQFLPDFPNQSFPANPSRARRRCAEPSSSHNNEGTIFGDVLAANSASSGDDCDPVPGREPGAVAEPFAETAKERSEAVSAKASDGQTGIQTRSQAGCRGCWRREADTGGPVRHLGRLHRDAERQEGVLRAGKTHDLENQSAEPSA